MRQALLSYGKEKGLSESEVEEVILAMDRTLSGMFTYTAFLKGFQVLESKLKSFPLFYSHTPQPPLQKNDSTSRYSSSSSVMSNGVFENGGNSNVKKKVYTKTTRTEKKTSTSTIDGVTQPPKVESWSWTTESVQEDPVQS
jgi:hypothetical protein